MKQKVLLLVMAVSGLSLLSSCVPLAAGAAGGYLLHKNGYRVQNPVPKADVKVQSPITRQPAAPTYQENYPAPAPPAY